MFKFNNKNYKTLKSLDNAKRCYGEYLIVRLDEISKSNEPENKKMN